MNDLVSNRVRVLLALAAGASAVWAVWIPDDVRWIGIAWLSLALSTAFYWVSVRSTSEVATVPAETKPAPQAVL